MGYAVKLQGGIQSLTPIEYVPMGNSKQTSFTGLNINKYRTMFVTSMNWSKNSTLTPSFYNKISNIVGANLIQSIQFNQALTTSAAHVVFGLHMLRPTSPDISYTITNGYAWGMTGTTKEFNNMNPLGSGINISSSDKWGLYHVITRSNNNIKYLMGLQLYYTSSGSFTPKNTFNTYAISNTRALSPQTVAAMNNNNAMDITTGTTNSGIFSTIRTVCEVGMDNKYPYYYSTSTAFPNSCLDTPLIHYVVGTHSLDGVVTLELS